MCRSRRELSNEYLLAKIGVDTAENEPLVVRGENSIHYSLHSLGGTHEPLPRRRHAAVTRHREARVGVDPQGVLAPREPRAAVRGRAAAPAPQHLPGGVAAVFAASRASHDR